jgi:YebC/PmpR family DNA-binding regulatory protein
MSGHSKWSSIKHKKAVADARRGKLFTKLIRDITAAARQGGSDPSANPRLRTAIAAAKAASMPGETVERAIRRGAGELEGASYEEVQYEGYGPGGVAIMLRVLTDNRNRAVAELRRVFTKYGGNLGETGCVAWMFDKKGVITVERGSEDEDRLLEIALEAGAEDVTDTGEGFEVLTAPENLDGVREELQRRGVPISSAEVSMMPHNTLMLSGAEAERALRLLEALEDLDDVQSVAANLEVERGELERIGEGAGSGA